MQELNKTIFLEYYKYVIAANSGRCGRRTIGLGALASGSGAGHSVVGDAVSGSTSRRGRHCRAGTYTAMPAGMRHFAYTKGEAVIQIGTNGPWGINYFNPADDPRQRNNK